MISRPNGRFYAMIGGDGLGVRDSMGQTELYRGALAPVPDVWLEVAGYFMVAPAPG